MKLTELLRNDGNEINVPRDLTAEQCAELLAFGFIRETGVDDERPDNKYFATDYARDLIWGRI